ncbi:MAG: DUF2203 domain-containing protein [Nitriliruptorales bacterium]
MRTFTLEEASALLPEARRRIGEVAAMTADLQRLAAEIQEAGEPPPGLLPDAKALEARIHEGLEWFARESIQVKGIAPALLDFPARTRDGVVLLCWREGEEGIAWFHPTDTGYLGRAPISEADLL